MLAEITGITREKTISTALSALEQAGWIERVHVPVTVGGKRTATLLRITLCRMGRNLPHTVTPTVRGGKRPKGRGQKTPQDSLSERAQPPLAPGGGVAPHVPTNGSAVSSPVSQPQNIPSAPGSSPSVSVPRSQNSSSTPGSTTSPSPSEPTPAAAAPEPLTVPRDPITGVPIPIVVCQATTRGDGAELERLQRVIEGLPEDQRLRVRACLPPAW
jgi:hypothetical protein